MTAFRRRCSSSVGLATFFVVLASLGHHVTAASPTYGSPQQVLQLGQTGFPSLLAVADFNDDGLQDVVVARLQFQSASTFALTILLNTGAGGYVDGTNSIFVGPPPRVQHPREIVVEDFNGDGRPDILIADHGQDVSPYPGYPNTLVLSAPGGLLQDASSFLPPQSDFTHSAAAADVDGDGDVDLYVGNIYGGNRVPPQIWLNDGIGHFAVASGLLPPAQANLDLNKYTASLFVDVDGDGFLDLVLAADDFTATSVVLLNNGSGHFSLLPGALPAKPFGPNAICLDIASADIDRDGSSDLLIACTKGNPFYVGRWVQVLVNTGDGTFHDETATRLPQSDNSSAWIKFLELLGIDDDDRLDLVARLAEGTSESPLLWRDTGATFASLSPGFGNTSQNLFGALDIDGDGGRDFLTAQWGGGFETYFIVRDNGPTLVPGPAGRVRASRFRPEGVRLTWPYVWGAQSYEIWRSGAPATTGAVVATTSKTHWDDTTAGCGQVFYYTVRAMNSAGTGPFSRPAAGALGVCDSDSIFSDGFESRDLGWWSAAATDRGQLSVRPAAALAGTSSGLQAFIDDTSSLFVQDDTPSAESRYRARFYFDPNGFDPGELAGHLRLRLLIAFDTLSRREVTLVLRRQSGAYSLEARVRRNDGSRADTGFFAITDAPHFFEFDWQRSTAPGASNGSLQLWIDDVSVATMSGIDNDQSPIEFVRMGALTVKSGASGTLYYDQFESRRQVFIGPE